MSKDIQCIFRACIPFLLENTTVPSWSDTSFVSKFCANNLKQLLFPMKGISVVRAIVLRIRGKNWISCIQNQTGQMKPNSLVSCLNSSRIRSTAEQIPQNGGNCIKRPKQKLQFNKNTKSRQRECHRYNGRSGLYREGCPPLSFHEEY